MSKIEDAIHRIKSLECPTGEVENRIVDILEEYGVANRNEIEVKEKEVLNNGATEFCATILGNNKQAIIVLASAGLDDYVAKINDAYLE